MNYSLTRLSSSRYQLRMQGACHTTNWIAPMSASLNALRIGVIEATASCEGSHCWNADFVLDFRHSQIPAAALDYAALPQRKAGSIISEAPPLRRFALIRHKDGTLKLMVEAEDRGGFLERFLTRVAALGLYPVQMTFGKTGQSIRATFALRGIGGRAPAQDAAGTMETLLRRMLERRAAQPMAVDPAVDPSVALAGATGGSGASNKGTGP